MRIAFMDGWKSLIPGDQVEQVFTALEQRLNSEEGFTLTVPFAVISARKTN